MIKYSQGDEQTVVLKYFGDHAKGVTFLDIGANDGITLSNTYALALISGKGLLVEPSPVAFEKLQQLHKDKGLVACLNAAISNKNGRASFHDSGSHLGTGDTSLLSTLNESDYQKWNESVEFKPILVDVMTVEKMLQLSPFKHFQFISIDAEGEDLNILKQLNLKELGCRCLCIEHNGDKVLKAEIIEYCAAHGLNKILLQNAENIILAK